MGVHTDEVEEEATSLVRLPTEVFTIKNIFSVC